MKMLGPFVLPENEEFDYTKQKVINRFLHKEREVILHYLENIILKNEYLDDLNTASDFKFYGPEAEAEPGRFGFQETEKSTKHTRNLNFEDSLFDCRIILCILR
jgi:hypothetical protein